MWTFSDGEKLFTYYIENILRFWSNKLSNLILVLLSLIRSYFCKLFHIKIAPNTCIIELLKQKYALINVPVIRSPKIQLRRASASFLPNYYYLNWRLDFGGKLRTLYIWQQDISILPVSPLVFSAFSAFSLCLSAPCYCW